MREYLPLWPLNIVCVHVCVYVCVCVDACLCFCMCICVCVCVYLFVCVYACVCAWQALCDKSYELWRHEEEVVDDITAVVVYFAH